MAFAFKLEGDLDRKLMAELRQCRHQFDRRKPVTHLHHLASNLQKLKRNLDRRLLAELCLMKGGIREIRLEFALCGRSRLAGYRTFKVRGAARRFIAPSHLHGTVSLLSVEPPCSQSPIP